MIVINGETWCVLDVPPNSEKLKRSNGTSSLGATHGNEHRIYMSNKLYSKYEHVLIHELCHAFCISYGIELDLLEEERLCNFVADYGYEILDIADMILKKNRRAVV